MATQLIPLSYKPPEITSLNLFQELERSQASLKQAEAEVEKLKRDLDRKTMETISLKKANQELDAELKYEIDRLKEQSRKDKEELVKVHEKTKQVRGSILNHGCSVCIVSLYDAPLPSAAPPVARRSGRGGVSARRNACGARRV